MHKRFVSAELSLFPLQHICEFVLKRFQALFAYGLGWHLCILPDEREMDRGQFLVPFDNIAGDGAWKGMSIDTCLVQGIALPFPNRRQVKEKEKRS